MSSRQSLTGRDELSLGAKAVVNGDLIGTIRFYGTTSFQTGKWVGVELDEATGKNSGVVQGKRYFECKPNHGVFVRPANVKITDTLMQRRKSTVTPPTQRRKSVATPASLPQRKSTIPPPPSKQEPPIQQRRKSIVAPPSLAQKRKSVISTPPPPPTPPNGETRTRRPTSLVQPATKSTAPMQLQQQRRKSIVAPKQSAVPTTGTRRPRSNTVTKSRPPTAPLTPETNDSQEDKKEQADFDALCNENTLANANMSNNTVASPVSLEHEDEDEEEQEEQEEQEKQEKPEEPEVNQTEQENNTYEPVYGSLASSKPVSKLDQTVPLKDYEELRFKLKILENKRHEDRERFREYEKVKEEAEQFLTLRNKLQDKIADLQKDVRDTRRDLKDVSTDKESIEVKYNDLLESMEMLTLDKEVAEERAENLQQEANMLKDRIEEISIDLDILKKEADMLNKPPENMNGDEERTPLEVIQLERHNERLKEALLRLRDATAEQEAELNYKIKSLEQENYELEEIRIQYEKTRERLDVTEIQMEDLKLQLDDALGTEDLVDQLTEKNLNLTEKADELQATVDDLEALRELADELEENHVETEKQLQAEIDHRDMLLREQLERLRANEETTADYETTIQQFRELVSVLQNDLDQLKQKEESEMVEKHTLTSQSQAMMSLNFQLQTSVMKAQAKSIDLELRKLDAAQANDRINIIQPYLPDAFFKTENDPISCLLLFKRLCFKADLIIKHLDQNYPISEKIMDNVTESLVTICEIKQRAGWLSSISTRFETFIKNCDPETFTRMGRVYLDLVGVERRMNAIVELFRTDQVNEAECLSEIQRVIAQVEHLAENHLGRETNNADQFFGITKALDLNADRMIVILTFSKQMIDNAARTEGLVIEEGNEEMDQNYLEPLGRLIAQAKNSKIIAKKLMRQLEDMFEEAMTLKSEHLRRFKMLHVISSKLCRFCFDTYRSILTYIDTKRGSQEPIVLSEIQNTMREKGDEVFEMLESSMWESALRTLKTLSNELETTHAQIENDDKLDKVTTKVAPWTQRASDIKAEVVVNHELEHKLQQHNEEIIKLIKDVKLKDQSLQESDVKVSLLEKRMEAAKKEAEQIKSLQTDLNKSVQQEQMYAEAVENLQAEYDTLEAENNALKKDAAKREEKRQSILRKANFDMPTDNGGDDATIQEMAGSYYEMTSQVETLKASIRYLRAENAHLKGSDFVRSLDLEPLKTPRPENRYTAVARETRTLIKDMRAASASPRVIQLSTKRHAHHQYQAQQSVLYTLQQRSLELRKQVDEIPVIHRTKKEFLGVIKVPSKTTNRHCVDLRSISEFEKIHSIFLKT